MIKTYFMIRPSDFVIHGDIDKHGESEYQDCKDFDVEDIEENFLIFEVEYSVRPNGKYKGYARELITKREFELTMSKDRDSKEEPKVLLTSDEHGVFQKEYKKLSEVEVPRRRISGLLNYFDRNEKPRNKYFDEIDEFFENARAFNHIHNQSEIGPSNYLLKRIRRFYKTSKSFTFPEDEDYY